MRPSPLLVLGTALILTAALPLSGIPATGLPSFGTATAQEAPEAGVRAGDLHLTGAFLRATLPRAPVAGAFLAIANGGAEADRLVSVDSPIGRNAEIHEMRMEGGNMMMRALPDGLELPAGGQVDLAPGGYHIMLNGLEAPLVEGETLDLVLHFEKAGAVPVRFDILAPNARSHAASPGTAPEAHGMHGNGGHPAPGSAADGHAGHTGHGTQTAPDAPR